MKNFLLALILTLIANLSFAQSKINSQEIINPTISQYIPQRISLESKNLLDLEKKAKNGNTTAQEQVGMIYHLFLMNYSQAKYWFEKASNQGSAEAKYRLGNLYFSGEGVVMDKQKALQLYQEAVNESYLMANASLGLAYLRGAGIPKNEKIALEKFLTIAEKDRGSAIYLTNFMYCNDSSQFYDVNNCQIWQKKIDAYTKNDKNYINSFQYIEDTAVLGELYSQINLANAYFLGKAITLDNKELPYEQNYSKALYWYNKAGIQGDAYAQAQLGNIYEKGLGINKNYEQALNWYKKSANQEYAETQAKLGYFYIKGIGGVPQNYALATDWSKKACDNGNQTGCDNYRNLKAQGF